MSALENILGMLPDRISSGKQDQIFTPAHIAKEMVNALPEDIWNRHTTFFDPICKSGIFLYEIYQKLMESADLIEAFPDKQDRREHIINNQLYGIAVDPMCQMMSIRSVYGYLEPNSHIILLNDYQTIMRNTDKRFLLETLQKEFGTMKFDVVIGNPPYNKGMDLDFVDLGYKLSEKYACFITPAKWQTTADDYSGCASKNIDYKQFRQLYVPHMSKVVFYPDCLDIFEIAQNDGITYFILDKSKIYQECEVYNKCVRQPYFNGYKQRSINNRETLVNIGAEIIEYLGDYKKYTWTENTITKKYYVATTALFSNSLGQGGSYDWNTGKIREGSAGEGGLLFTKNGDILVLSKSILCEKGTPVKSSTKVTFQSDSIDECNNFYSYLYSKFVRFFLLINESQMNNAVKPDWFRLVPAPDIKEDGTYDWSHKYSDEYLYKKYNLPQKYIDVIESVIKERK